ncbi:serpin family protein [Streptomyces sp. NRRL WC-3742]|uniref:serpin family protein n=1 Tax=Streptomyces sp. NRRL WC-3742 TaxID=1463934 RepID=UPI0005684988|nr:serpin family protein [Streptomyces sp. NRRL WC-3742]
MSRAEAVRAANALGARWAGQAVDGEQGTVLMPAGLWPLLGLLAPAGSGPVRAELAEALGLAPASAAERARELLGLLREIPAVRAALGVWTAPGVRLRPAWAAGFPADVHWRLTGDAGQDRKTLDEWAARCTDGMIDAMPLEVSEDTLLVLATALVLRTDWIRPFRDFGGPPGGGEETWARPVHYLSRTGRMLDRASLLETPYGPVTELRVLGDRDIDVRLLLGEADAAASTVLASGFEALGGRHRRTGADRLPFGEPGPGLRIDRLPSYRPEDELRVDVPQFTVEAHHDLLERRELFGLATASSASRTEDRLPGLAEAGEPLFIGGAAQRATATFGRLGFRAAAVTAFGVAGGSAASRPPYLVREARVWFGRPFGFLAVHRTTGLVLAAGWVTEPEPSHDPYAGWGSEDEEEGWEDDREA